MFLARDKDANARTRKRRRNAMEGLSDPLEAMSLFLCIAAWFMGRARNFIGLRCATWQRRSWKEFTRANRRWGAPRFAGPVSVPRDTV